MNPHDPTPVNPGENPPQPPTGSGEQGNATQAGESLPPGASPTPGSGENAGPSGEQPGYVQEIIHLRQRAQEAEQKSAHLEQTLGTFGPLLQEAQTELRTLSAAAASAEVEKQKASIALEELRRQGKEYDFDASRTESEIRRLESEHQRQTEAQELAQQNAQMLQGFMSDLERKIEDGQRRMFEQVGATQQQQTIGQQLDARLQAAQVEGPVAENLKNMALATWEAQGRQGDPAQLLDPVLAQFRVTQATQAATTQQQVQQHPVTQQGSSGAQPPPPDQPIRLKDAPPEIRQASMTKQLAWLNEKRAAAAMNQG